MARSVEKGTKTMPDAKDNERRAEVTHDGKTVETLWDPAFIVKRGDRYYLTLAVWEYEKGPGHTPEQREGVAEVIALFDSAVLQGNLLAAVMIPNNIDHGVFTQIKPGPHPPPQPT